MCQSSQKGRRKSSDISRLNRTHEKIRDGDLNIQRIDRVFGQVEHQVRWKNGQVLTAVELENERRLFEYAPMWTLERNMPSMTNSWQALCLISMPKQEVRPCIHVSPVASFAPRGGDTSLLQTLWNQVGITSNHQTLFALFDWGNHFDCKYFPRSQVIFYSEYFNVLRVHMVEILFKTIFDHIFPFGIADITNYITTKGWYSLEFESKGAYCFVSNRFWKEDNLSTVRLRR